MNRIIKINKNIRQLTERRDPFERWEKIVSKRNVVLVNKEITDLFRDAMDDLKR